MSHNDKFYYFSTLQMIVTVIKTFTIFHHFNGFKQTNEIKIVGKTGKTIPFGIATAYRSTIERGEKEMLTFKYTNHTTTKK